MLYKYSTVLTFTYFIPVYDQLDIKKAELKKKRAFWLKNKQFV